MLSRFCSKPDQEAVVVAYLERHLLSSTELDAEINRRLTLARSASCASVLDTGLECPSPASRSHDSKGLGTFYDFCHYAKMCAECGKMADDDVKMRVCAGCKTEHYCSRACQKIRWAKEHRGKCETLFSAQAQHNLAHLCCQIASCMCVWGQMHSKPEFILHNMSDTINRAGLHDVLWLVSFQKEKGTVVFSTVSRTILVRLVGRQMVHDAVEESGPTRRVVLIVPSKHVMTGALSYTLCATFLNAT